MLADLLVQRRLAQVRRVRLAPQEVHHRLGRRRARTSSSCTAGRWRCAGRRGGRRSSASAPGCGVGLGGRIRRRGRGWGRGRGRVGGRGRASGRWRGGVGVGGGVATAGGLAGTSSARTTTLGLGDGEGSGSAALATVGPTSSRAAPASSHARTSARGRAFAARLGASGLTMGDLECGRSGGVGRAYRPPDLDRGVRAVPDVSTAYQPGPRLTGGRWSSLDVAGWSRVRWAHRVRCGPDRAGPVRSGNRRLTGCTRR